MAIAVFYDVPGKRLAIQRAISKYGSGPEHNFYHYWALRRKDARCAFVSFGRARGILSIKDDSNVWTTLDKVLAPPSQRVKLMAEFVGHAFGKLKAKKIVIESSPEFRRQLKKLLPQYKFPKIRFSLYWPVFDLKSWDSELNGGRWKKVRNLRNRLHKWHSIRIRDSRKVREKELIALVDKWAKQRFLRDRADKQKYINMIKNKFRSCSYTRSIIVDGKAATISGGWPIPNSKDVYSSLGILDYSIKGLGEVAYIDEFDYLKKKGFRKANLGGSDRSMLGFKKKFFPEGVYRTDTFAILKK